MAYKVEKFPMNQRVTCVKLTNEDTGKVAKAKVYFDGTPAVILPTDPFFRSKNDMSEEEINAERKAMTEALVEAFR